MIIQFIQMREIFIVSFIFLLITSVTAMAKTYRWIDENGKVYYSHDIPPSAAQNGHTELNEKSGRVLNDIASREEREKRQRQAILLKAAEKEKQLKIREALSLQLFSSRAEVIRHFERRLEMVSVNLRLLQYHKRRLLKEITKIQQGQSTSSIKTKKERRIISKRLQKMQSTLLEHTRAIENNQQEQIVIFNNKKRALSRYDDEKIEGSTVKEGLEMYLDDLIMEANDKSECACTCDKKKRIAKD